MNLQQILVHFSNFTEKYETILTKSKMTSNELTNLISYCQVINKNLFFLDVDAIGTKFRSFSNSQGCITKINFRCDNEEES